MTRKVMDDLRVVTSSNNFMVGRIGQEKVYCDGTMNESYNLHIGNSLSLRDAVMHTYNPRVNVKWQGNCRERFMEWFSININNLDKESNGLKS